MNEEIEYTHMATIKQRIVAKKLLENSDYKVPSWLERKAAMGKIGSVPKREDITEPISEQDIVEFYSR